MVNTISRNIANAVASAANGAKLASPATGMLSKVQAFLIAMIAMFTAETKKMFDEKQLKFSDEPYYVRREIGASGRIEIFNDGLNKLVGWTNISKAKLDQYINLALERIEVMYATVTGTDTEDVMLKKAAWKPLFDFVQGYFAPAELTNGEIELVVGSKVIYKAPLRAFVEGVPGTANSLANGVNLDSKEFIKEGDTIQIYVIPATALDVAANKRHMVEIMLKGTSTKKRV